MQFHSELGRGAGTEWSVFNVFLVERASPRPENLTLMPILKLPICPHSPSQYLRTQSTDCLDLDAGCHTLFCSTHTHTLYQNSWRSVQGRVRTGLFDTQNAIAKSVVMALEF